MLLRRNQHTVSGTAPGRGARDRVSPAVPYSRSAGHAIPARHAFPRGIHLCPRTSRAGRRRDRPRRRVRSRSCGRTERRPGAGARPTVLPPDRIACSSCHYQFLSLKPFGREFKASGYTLTTLQIIREKEKEKENGNTLALSPIPMIGFMVQASFTELNTTIPGTQNGDASLPQQLSLFLAGAISPRIGIFSQLTYSGADNAIGIDNIDVRYANHIDGSVGATYGATLNNNPTVTDLWNTTPAWGWPFAASDVAPTPGATTLIDGGLAQQVLGLSGYVLVGKTVYGEFGVYRSALQGLALPDSSATDLISGVAPYWRLAIQKEWKAGNIELGTFGLHASQFPVGVSGPTDSRTDVGVDAQWEQHLGPGYLVTRGTWIHEDDDLQATFESGGVTTAKNSLSTFKLNSSYYPRQWIGVTLGYFESTGTTDALLYPADPVSGSVTGSPNSDGVTMEVDYNPWQNVRLGLQYTWYGKFNGSTTNYDGTGRNASANNTLYLFAWLVF